TAVYRKDRNIFEACDTNMLIEAWHHVLKGKFLLNKRNRRMDHLVWTLIMQVMPYHSLKQRRQDLGFEGIDIEVRKRRDIVKRSQQYTKDDIEHVDEEQYLVRSKSEPSHIYEVDISTYTCTCLDFPLISYCKHICAVQTLFEEHAPQVPLSSCTTTTPPNASTTLQSSLPEEPSQAPVAKPQSMRKVVAEKLERLAARLWHLSTKEPIELLPCLDQLADQMLAATDKGSVLPAAHHVEPHTKPWRETALSMGVLPKPKTRARPIDANRDPHYGGGASSGGKA
ncbi:hypothetical protein DFH07DRAFT_711389, partial [Mycena maculata]